MCWWPSVPSGDTRLITGSNSPGTADTITVAGPSPSRHTPTASWLVCSST
jgi:hypothetical protein